LGRLTENKGNFPETTSRWARKLRIVLSVSHDKKYHESKVSQEFLGASDDEMKFSIGGGLDGW